MSNSCLDLKYLHFINKKFIFEVPYLSWLLCFSLCIVFVLYVLLAALVFRYWQALADWFLCASVAGVQFGPNERLSPEINWSPCRYAYAGVLSSYPLWVLDREKSVRASFLCVFQGELLWPNQARQRLGDGRTRLDNKLFVVGRGWMMVGWKPHLSSWGFTDVMWVQMGRF